MSQSTETKSKRSLWYQQPDAVSKTLNGVFEGGGAKGIAYTGALRTLKERGCWFSSVAGASAGAITAVLVAAGFEPEQMEELAIKALSAVKPPAGWHGIKYPLIGYPYFRKEGLRQWLKSTLSDQMKSLGVPSDDPSFRQLFQATGIELNVIATSLSLKDLAIFSHLDTPECSVADAVAASSSIPFAFEDSILEVEVDGERWHQTIVDGGVWANFPWFVYTDPHFRKLYERKPEVLPPESIIGFILDESRAFAGTDRQEALGTRKLLHGPNIRFSDSTIEVWPWETRPARLSPEQQESSESRPWLVAQLVHLLAMLGKAMEDSQSKEIMPDRWPQPRTALRRGLLDHVSGLLEALASWEGLLATAFILVFSGLAFSALTGWFLFAIFSSSFSGWIVAKVFLIVLWGLIFVSAVFTGEFLIISVVAARLLNRPLRHIGYGLIMTYLTGSSAPEWTRRDPRVISLAVGGIALTEFKMDPTKRTDVIDRAERDTAIGLDAIGLYARDQRIVEPGAESDG